MRVAHLYRSTLHTRADPPDGVGDLIERKDLVDAAGLDRLSRHAEDDGGLLRLGDGFPAAVVNLLYGPRPVVPHPGHDHGHEVLATAIAGAAEEPVDGGSVKVVHARWE